MKALLLLLVLVISVVSCESESGKRAAIQAPIKAVILNVNYDLKEGMYYTKVKLLSTNTVAFRYMTDRYDKGDTIMVR